MNKLEFNSQVCTTVEQSKKLLELGLRPETADCHYLLMDDNWSMGFGFWKQPHQNVPTHYIPAWSLHRLIDLLYVNHIKFVWEDGCYEQAIQLLEKRITEGFIPKEFLNK